MIRGMKAEGLEKRLQDIDDDLTNRGVPIVERALLAFNVLAQEPDNRGASELGTFDHVAQWYITKYGEHAIWDGIIGEQPVVLRGSIVVARVPFTVTNKVIQLSEAFRLPKEVANTLSDAEINTLGATLGGAFEDFTALYNLETRPSLLSSEQWTLVRRAKFDLKAAALLLRESGDTQGAITHAHQAAEKIMKAVLVGYGLSVEKLRKRMSHNLAKACNELATHHRKFEYLRPWVVALDRLLGSMSIRYTEVRRSAEHAVAAYVISRQICGFIARQWQLDADRGKPDLVLEPGKFYRQDPGRMYRCISLANNRDGSPVAKMILLGQETPLGIMDCEMTIKANCGFLFAEITDSGTVRRLEERYEKLAKK